MRTVVIVDDYDGFRTAARRLLEAGGYHVVGEALDGESAVATVEQLRPDVVLLDVILPDTSGFDVADRLARVDPNTRIVLVSSRDEQSHGVRVRRPAVCGFIYKGDLSPRTLDALLERCA